MNGIMMNGMINKRSTSSYTSTILNHVHTENNHSHTVLNHVHTRNNHSHTVLNHVCTKNNHSCTISNHVRTINDYSRTLHLTRIQEHCRACPSDVSTRIYDVLSSSCRAYTSTKLRCLQASHLDFSCKRLHAPSHLEDGHTCCCSTDTGTASPCEHSGVYPAAPW